MGLYGVTRAALVLKPFISFCHSSCVIIPALLAALLGYHFVTASGAFIFDSDHATIVFFNFFNGQQRLFNGTNG